MSEGKFEKFIKGKMFDMDEIRFKDLPMTLTRRKIAEDVNLEYKEILELVDEAKDKFPKLWLIQDRHYTREEVDILKWFDRYFKGVMAEKEE